MVYYENQYRCIRGWLAKDGHESVLVLHQALASTQKAAAHVEMGVKTVSGDAKVELMESKVGTTEYVFVQQNDENQTNFPINQSVKVGPSLITSASLSIAQNDGPMLEALKALNGREIRLPNLPKDRPDCDRLAVR